MQSRLMVRLLQRSALRTQGFTLIELLVVVAIGGILAAIAIPSFLGRANTAKQVEAKMYVGTLNRSQEAFYIEHSRFAKSPQELGVYRQPSGNYEYEVDVPSGGGLRAVHYANSKIFKLRSYAGMVALVQQGSVLQTVICEAENPEMGRTETPVYGDSTVTCGSGTKQLN